MTDVAVALYTGIVTCDDLPNPPKGNVVQSDNTVGSTATYTCFDGYELLGEDTRICQDDGDWSGDEPLCIRKWVDKFIFTFKVIYTITAYLKLLVVLKLKPFFPTLYNTCTRQCSNFCCLFCSHFVLLHIWQVSPQ